MDFNIAVRHVLKFEGGLVDHPSDPGGITNRGISIRAYPRFTPEDIRNLSMTETKSIYREDYWNAVHADELPEGVRLITFDAAVNQGAYFARRALQIAASVPIDGSIGPVTLKALHEANTEALVHKIAQVRFNRYEANRNWVTFGGGWMNRLFSVLLTGRS